MLLISFLIEFLRIHILPSPLFSLSAATSQKVFENDYVIRAFCFQSFVGGRHWLLEKSVMGEVAEFWKMGVRCFSNSCSPTANFFLLFGQVLQNTFLERFRRSVLKCLLGCEKLWNRLLTMVHVWGRRFTLVDLDYHLLWFGLGFKNWDFLCFDLGYRQLRYLVAQWKSAWVLWVHAKNWAGVTKTWFKARHTHLLRLLRVSQLLHEPIWNLSHLLLHCSKHGSSLALLLIVSDGVSLNLFAPLLLDTGLRLHDILARLPTKQPVVLSREEFTCLTLVEKVKQVHLWVGHEVYGFLSWIILDEKANFEIAEDR